MSLTEVIPLIQLSIHGVWKIWLQGSSDTVSSHWNCSKQTQHWAPSSGNYISCALHYTTCTLLKLPHFYIIIVLLIEVCITMSAQYALVHIITYAVCNHKLSFNNISIYDQIILMHTECIHSMDRLMFCYPNSIIITRVHCTSTYQLDVV